MPDCNIKMVGHVRWPTVIYIIVLSVMNWSFCHFRPFFALLPPYQPKKSKFWKNEKNGWRYCHITPLYHKWQSCDVWFLNYSVRQAEFFVILDYFLHFFHFNNPKNQNFEKMKKMAGDIIISHKCIINNNHMVYGFSEMRRERQKFVILDHFLPFYSPNNPKNQNFEKLKKTPGDITILHKCIKNHNHMLYCS